LQDAKGYLNYSQKKNIFFGNNFGGKNHSINTTQKNCVSLKKIIGVKI
jgi:hypothetical protein